MFDKKYVRNILSVSIILFSSSLFVLKFSHIYLQFSFIVTFFYLVVFVLIIAFLDKIEINSEFLFYLLLALIFVSLIYVLIFPRFGQINRLTAIEDWCGLFDKGKFPYNSNLAPSSFPGLFFIAYPFYKLNLLSILEVFALIFLAFLIFEFNRTNKERLISVALVLFSPFVYYSLVVRSELIFNTTLILLAMWFLMKFVKPGKSDSEFIIFAILTGVTLSTRAIFVFPLVIFSLFYFREYLKNLFLFWIIVGIVFLLILLPFYLWDRASFLINGPFAVQSKAGGLNIWITGLFLFLSLYAGWAVKNLKEVFFISGLFLFLMPVFSYCFKIYDFGFYTAFIQDKIDLSYLAFSFPFLLLSLKEENRKK
jgi:hypothetical protein